MNGRIRKFNGPDGRVAWVFTHIDAVMGDNGVTLRQILKGLTVLDPSQIGEVMTELEQMTQQVSGVSEALNTKYTYPQNGIPSTDMTSAVQTTLTLAEGSVQAGDIVGVVND